MSSKQADIRDLIAVNDFAAKDKYTGLPLPETVQEGDIDRETLGTMVVEHFADGKRWPMPHPLRISDENLIRTVKVFRNYQPGEEDGFSAMTTEDARQRGVPAKEYWEEFSGQDNLYVREAMFRNLNLR